MGRTRERGCGDGLIFVEKGEKEKKKILGRKAQFCNFVLFFFFSISPNLTGANKNINQTTVLTAPFTGSSKAETQTAGQTRANYCIIKLKSLKFN